MHMGPGLNKKEKASGTPASYLLHACSTVGPAASHSAITRTVPLIRLAGKHKFNGERRNLTLGKKGWESTFCVSELADLVVFNNFSDFGVGISYPNMYMPDQVLHPLDTPVGRTMNLFQHASPQIKLVIFYRAIYFFKYIFSFSFLILEGNGYQPKV